MILHHSGSPSFCMKALSLGPVQGRAPMFNFNTFPWWWTPRCDASVYFSSPIFSNVCNFKMLTRRFNVFLKLNTRWRQVYYLPCLNQLNVPISGHNSSPRVPKPWNSLWLSPLPHSWPLLKCCHIGWWGTVLNQRCKSESSTKLPSILKCGGPKQVYFSRAHKWLWRTRLDKNHWAGVQWLKAWPQPET